eukprot:1969480-Pleurochrysis_carterae.AAC.1
MPLKSLYRSAAGSLNFSNPKVLTKSDFSLKPARDESKWRTSKDSPHQKPSGNNQTQTATNPTQSIATNHCLGAEQMAA